MLLNHLSLTSCQRFYDTINKIYIYINLINMSLPKIEYRSPISGRKSPNANLYTESSYIS